MAYLAALAALCGPVAADDCLARAEAPLGIWATGYEVVASTQGRDCVRAIATIAIQDTNQRRIWALSYEAASIRSLASAATPAAMTEGLRQWIESKRGVFRTSAELPKFSHNGSREVGAYRFFPAEGLSSREYEKLRLRNLPVFCYAEGPGTGACIVIDRADRDAVTKVGRLNLP